MPGDFGLRSSPRDQWDARRRDAFTVSCSSGFALHAHTAHDEPEALQRSMAEPFRGSGYAAGQACMGMDPVIFYATNMEDASTGGDGGCLTGVEEERQLGSYEWRDDRGA
jgi:hypothetical protein